MATIIGTNPRTGEHVGVGVAQTDGAALDGVLAAAHRAATDFAASPPAVRATLLRSLAEHLDAESDTLVALAELETGLPSARLRGEVARTSFQLRLFATVVEEGSYLEVTIDTADPDTPRPDLRRTLAPLGPVLVFAASNFPFAFSVLGGDTASALAAGCPVVVKAHESHPALSEAVADLAHRVIAAQRLAPGVLSVIHGVEPGRAALTDPRVTACGFTGSTAGGRALFDLANRRPTPIAFYGELGSVNPVVVTPGAVAARGAEIAAGYVASFTLGTGQFCTKPGLLFLPRGHGLDAALARAVGDVGPAPMLAARIYNAFTDGTAELAAHKDIRTITSGVDGPGAGSWAAPALFATTAKAVLDDPARLTAECFGPASIVVEYDGVDELLASLATVEGSLTATIHGEPGEDFPLPRLLAAAAARAGRIIWNGWPTGVSVAWAMQHGGPWPASTNPLHTSVGATSIRRWLRPLCFQSVPDALLPPPLRAANPWRLPRRVDGLSHGSEPESPD